MDTSPSEHFRDFVQNHDCLSEIYQRLNEKINFQIGETSDLNLEIRLLHRKLKRYISERQRPLSEGDQLKIRFDIHDLVYKLERIKKELKDLEKVRKTYRDKKLIVWNKIKILFENQREDFDEIKL